MKAAIVQGAWQTPAYRDFEEPVPAQDENRIFVTAAAISQNVKSRASGQRYSSSGRFPFVVGTDGVGSLEGGGRVYFVMPRAPYGSMAERTVVPSARCLSLPDDLDDATAAAIANPGMSSWAAYTERAKLKAGETVLVNGATETAGRLAVQIAKHLGATKVIATGRNVDALRQLEALGADVTIPLVDDDAARDASSRPLTLRRRGEFAVERPFRISRTLPSLQLMSALALPGQEWPSGSLVRHRCPCR